MINSQEINFIKQTIFDLLNFSYNGDITVEESDHLEVTGNAEKAKIKYSKKSELARGFFLLAKEIASCNESFSIKQKAHFKDCGVMLDFSRGSIYKPKAVKTFITNMAALGMNTLYLYLEDTYELEAYPYFGYMRGRYSAEEIREMDEFAQKLGIELIPCIQTLAHLAIYLKWEEAAKVKDSAEVLLVGEEETYKLIKAMIQFLSKAFKSRRIHIGMDEAHTMGQGRYAKLHKEIDKKKMFIEHLLRVKKICEDEGLSPIIWSDMIFRLCGGEGGVNEEYDPNSVITQDISEAIKGLNLTYWDYYRTNQKEYESIIQRHQKFDAEISFAGAVWTWDGYLPNFRYSFDTMLPAMRACLNNNIKEVYATLWGTNGTDTDYLQAVAGLSAFSEYCYLGMECTEDDIFETAEYLTGTNKEILYAVSDFFLGYDGAVGIGERLVDADLMLEQLRFPIDYKAASETFKSAKNILSKYPDNSLASYGAMLLNIAAKKSEIFSLLRSAYQEKNYDVLKRISSEIIPGLVDDYKAFIETCERLMEENRKPFGTEIIHIRLAGIERRLQYAQEKLQDYISGKIEVIEELCEKALNEEHATWLHSEAYMKTM